MRAVVGWYQLPAGASRRRSIPALVAVGLVLPAFSGLLSAGSAEGAVPPALPVPELSIVAGTGTPAAPTPGPAIDSPLNQPAAVAVSSAGTMYIADTANNVVEMVTPDGVLSIFAGTGSAGTPTPGPALESGLDNPLGLAVDGAGNVYIADTGNHSVEMVTPDGELSVIAGTGSDGPPTPGPATSSELRNPIDVAVDADGNVLIADPGNSVVERVGPGGVLSIFAGTGSAGLPTAGPALNSELAFPAGVAVGADGTVFIADLFSQVVAKVTPDGVLSIFAGTGNLGPPTPGPALGSDLAYPSGVALDGRGNLFIAGYESPWIEKVTPEGELSILAGSGDVGPSVPGPPTDSPLSGVIHLATDGSGRVYLAEYNNNTVSMVTQPDVPSQPLNPGATAGSGQASVTWDAPEFDGQLPVTSYLVLAYVDDDQFAPDKTCTIASPFAAPLTCDVTGLSDGTAYTFTVTATNEMGAGDESVHSDPVTPFTPATVPGPPRNVTASPGDGLASVTWDAPESDGRASLIWYSAQAFDDGSPVDGATCAITAPFTPPLTCDVTGLTNGTAYTFVVTATNSVGSGEESTPSSAVTPQAAAVTTVVLPPMVTTSVVVTPVVVTSVVAAPVVVIPVVVTPAAVPTETTVVVAVQQADSEGTQSAVNGTLAHTGTNAGRDLAIAGLLIVIGSLMVVGARRRRSPR